MVKLIIGHFVPWPLNKKNTNKKDCVKSTCPKWHFGQIGQGGKNSKTRFFKLVFWVKKGMIPYIATTLCIISDVEMMNFFHLILWKLNFIWKKDWMKLHANFHNSSIDFMTKVKAWIREQVNKMSQNSNMFPKMWENESQQSQMVFSFKNWSPMESWNFETKLKVVNMVSIEP